MLLYSSINTGSRIIMNEWKTELLIIDPNRFLISVKPSPKIDCAVYIPDDNLQHRSVCYWFELFLLVVPIDFASNTSCLSPAAVSYLHGRFSVSISPATFFAAHHNLPVTVAYLSYSGVSCHRASLTIPLKTLDHTWSISLCNGWSGHRADGMGWERKHCLRHWFTPWWWMGQWLLSR